MEYISQIDLRQTSLIWRGAVVTQAVALLMAIIGYSSHNLMDIIHEGGADMTMGLWRVCWPGLWPECLSPADTFKNSDLGNGWITTCRALMTLAWLIEIVVIALSVGALIPQFKSKLLSFIIAGVALLSSIFGLIGITVFFNDTIVISPEMVFDAKDVKQGWAYYIFLLSQIAYLLCSILHLVDGIKPSFLGNFVNPPDDEELSGQQSTAAAAREYNPDYAIREMDIMTHAPISVINEI